MALATINALVSLIMLTTPTLTPTPPPIPAIAPDPSIISISELSAAERRILPPAMTVAAASIKAWVMASISITRTEPATAPPSPAPAIAAAMERISSVAYAPTRISALAETFAALPI